MVGFYRPLKASSRDYHIRLELKNFLKWAVLQKEFVTIIGAFNLDRMRIDKREGKILRDLEEVRWLECLVIMPTRVTNTSESIPVGCCVD